MNTYDQTKLTDTCQSCHARHKITYWQTEFESDYNSGKKTYMQYHAGCLKCGVEVKSRLIRIIRDI